MIFVFALFCCLAGSLALPAQSYYDVNEADTLFVQFMQTFDKHYANEKEKQERFEIFKKKLVEINKLNKGNTGTPVYGITKFSDMTEEEFLSIYTCQRGPKDSSECQATSVSHDVSLPDDLDWEKENQVSPVKNQKNCGSCWIFSAVANIESMYARKHKQIVDLSEQQVLDCFNADSYGCNGGWNQEALMYVQKAGGIMGEKDYPYSASVGQCDFDQKKVQVRVTNCTQFSMSSEDEMRQALYDNGPLSIAVCALTWSSYTGGIVTDCPQCQLNHAVLLVGYGTENGTPFWRIKNSWGENWGEHGYIRIERNTNACNIMSQGSVIATAQVE